MRVTNGGIGYKDLVEMSFKEFSGWHRACQYWQLQSDLKEIQMAPMSMASAEDRKRVTETLQQELRELVSGKSKEEIYRDNREDLKRFAQRG